MASIMIKKAGEGLISQAHRNADVEIGRAHV